MAAGSSSRSQYSVNRQSRWLAALTTSSTTSCCVWAIRRRPATGERCGRNPRRAKSRLLICRRQLAQSNSPFSVALLRERPTDHLCD